MGVEWSFDLEVGWNLEQWKCGIGHPLTDTSSASGAPNCASPSSFSMGDNLLMSTSERNSRRSSSFSPMVIDHMSKLYVCYGLVISII